MKRRRNVSSIPSAVPLKSSKKQKKHAAEEAAGIIEAARHEATAEAIRLRDLLRNDVAALAVKGAEQILKREIDAKAHAELLNQLKAEL